MAHVRAGYARTGPLRAAPAEVLAAVELGESAPVAGGGRNRDRQVVVAGLVVDLRTRNTQSGTRMAFVTLDDRSARMEIRLFSRVYDRYQALLANDKVLVIEGSLAFDDFSGSMRMNADKVYEIDEAREIYARRVVLEVSDRKAEHDFVRTLASTLTPFREGTCPVGIRYQAASAQAQLTLGENWYVHPTDELLHRLRELAGEARVHVVY